MGTVPKIKWKLVSTLDNIRMSVKLLKHIQVHILAFQCAGFYKSKGHKEKNNCFLIHVLKYLKDKTDAGAFGCLLAFSKYNTL